MAIQFRAATNVSWTTNATSQAFTLPTGWQPGDIGFVCLLVGTSAMSITQTGGTGTWTIQSSVSNSTGYTPAFAWRLLQAGDTGPTFGWGTATKGVGVCLGFYSDAGRALSIDAWAAEQQTTSTTTHTTPSVNTLTPAGASEASVVLTVCRNSSSTTAVTFTSWAQYSGWTSGANTNVFQSISGSNAKFAAADYKLGVSGTVSPGTATLTDSAAGNYSFDLIHVLVSEAVPPVFLPQAARCRLARSTRARGWQQTQPPSPPPGGVTFQGIDTLAGTGSIGTPAVILDAGSLTALAGAGSIGTPAVTIGAPATLAGTASIGTPAAIQGVLGTSLGGAGSVGSPDAGQGGGGGLGGQGSITGPDVIQGVITTVTGAGSVTADLAVSPVTTLAAAGSLSAAVTIGAPATLNGTASIGIPAVIQGAKTTLAGTGSITGTNIRPTESGPLHIILPGAFARITSGAFTPVIPGPALSVAGFAGTASTFTLKLPRPATGLAGKVVHSVVKIVIPKPVTGLAGKVIHNPLNLKIPKPATGLAGKRASAGPLTIQLGVHRSVPRPPARPARETFPAQNPGRTTVTAGQHAPSSKPVTGQGTNVAAGEQGRGSAGVTGRSGRGKGGVS